MSDYSFMKSGLGTVDNSNKVDIDLENVEVLLSMFITNAIGNASKYVKMCGRKKSDRWVCIFCLHYLEKSKKSLKNTRFCIIFHQNGYNLLILTLN